MLKHRSSSLKPAAILFDRASLMRTAAKDGQLGLHHCQHTSASFTLDELATRILVP